VRGVATDVSFKDGVPRKGRSLQGIGRTGGLACRGFAEPSAMLGIGSGVSGPSGGREEP
jgi:hypothetical protein